MHGPRVFARQADIFDKIAVGAHVYFPDAHVVSTWVPFETVLRRSDGRSEIGAMDTLCVFSNRGASAMGYEWQFTVTPLRDAAGAAVVRVNWHRSKERGQVTDSPKGLVELTLAPGKSVPLDYIVPAPEGAGTCRAVGMLLEISLRN
jgi:hypothetical protein